LTKNQLFQRGKFYQRGDTRLCIVAKHD